MALILFIDTSADEALVGLERDGLILAVEKNKQQKEHASFLHPAIERLLKSNHLTTLNLDAVAISSGPGSYTGLRVAMATAKGLCFALNIPLITVNTLKLMAKAAILVSENKNCLFCPMIDARRMEVFTALYNSDLEEILHPFALVLHEKSYSDYLADNSIYFFGNGALKWKEITTHTNAHFLAEPNTEQAFTLLAEQNFKAALFSDLALSEPEYVKAFYDGN